MRKTMSVNARLWITISLGLILLLAVTLPGIRKAYDSAKQVESFSYAKQLGMVLFACANDNNGEYPNDLEALLKNGDLTDPKLIYKAGTQKLLWKLTPNLSTNDKGTILFQSVDTTKYHDKEHKIVYVIGDSIMDVSPDQIIDANGKRPHLKTSPEVPGN